MASVEEICDHITLINKSHNILSGSLEQIRREHGTNIFEVEFIGDRTALATQLTGKGFSLLEADDEEPSAVQKLKIHIDDHIRIKELVSDINSTVEIRSFREIIPSMNDIFIKAVSGIL